MLLKMKNYQFYQYNNLTNFSTELIIFINICEPVISKKKLLFLRKKYKISFYFFFEKAAVYIFYFEESKCYNFLTSINSRHNLFILICLAEPYRLIKKAGVFYLWDCKKYKRKNCDLKTFSVVICDQYSSLYFTSRRIKILYYFWNYLKICNTTCLWVVKMWDVL